MPTRSLLQTGVIAIALMGCAPHPQTPTAPPRAVPTRNNYLPSTGESAMVFCAVETFEDAGLPATLDHLHFPSHEGYFLGRVASETTEEHLAWLAEKHSASILAVTTDGVRLAITWPTPPTAGVRIVFCDTITKLPAPT